MADDSNGSGKKRKCSQEENSNSCKTLDVWNSLRRQELVEESKCARPQDSRGILGQESWGDGELYLMSQHSLLTESHNACIEKGSVTAKSLHGEDEYSHSDPGLVYTSTAIPGVGVDLEEWDTQLLGCSCVGDCILDCPCSLGFGPPYDEYGNLTLEFLQDNIPVKECNEECSCGSMCRRQVVQRGPWQALYITHTAGKGLGVITTKTIPRGAFVCEYAGEVIGKEEAVKRFSGQKETDPNYILVLREHTSSLNVPILTIIDPTVIGNIGRYLNHSCEPNLILVPVRINRPVPLVVLFALRDILPGEELCYDYGCVQGKGNEVKEGGPVLNFDFQEKRQKMGISATFLKPGAEGNECTNSAGFQESLCGHPSQVEQRGDKVRKFDPTVSTQPTSSSSGQKKQSMLYGANKALRLKKDCLCRSSNCRKFIPFDDNIF